MSAIKIIQAYAKKSLTKNQGSGITTLPSQFMAESKAGEIAAILQQAGMPLQQLDNFIRSEADLVKFLNIIKNAKPVSTSETASGVVLPFKQKRSFAEEIDAMKKSGDLVDVDDINISEKITDRDMFKNSFLNKPTIEGQMEKITGASNKIKQIQKEQADMYKPKSDAEIAAKYDKENKESIQRFKDKMKKDEPEDKATGGRAGFYTGGITDVEPSLDDIGHGADAMMSRTRLMSPGSQTTTSTGLNYLLAEDNDNMRIPFAGGGRIGLDDGGFLEEALAHYDYYIKSGGKIPFRKFLGTFAKENRADGGRIGLAGGGGRRAFLKMLGLTGAGIAGLKTGMVGLGEGGVKKAVTETVKQSAGGTYPPPYFFKLVEKIKFMGDDITEKAATQEREIVKRYKDYEMTEDIGTGNIVIKKRNEGVFYDQDGIISDEYIVYKPGQADELTKGKKPPPEYDEYTVRPDSDGKLKDSEDGLDSIDEILEEVGDTTAMTIKKADGGRIGFSGGNLAKLLAGKKITGSSGRFLEKIFGKGSLNEISKRDPEMHRGLLEVVEMFRSRDKAGLVEYMQNFLPHMSKKEIQAFIKGDAVDAAGQGKYGLGDMQGQLIRLGSGRDYKGKLEAMQKLENAQKLDTLDVTEEMIRKPNSDGGRIGFSGGGIFRAIIAKAAANAGTTPYNFIKKTGYKSLPPRIKMFMSKSDYEKLKFGQEEMYSNYVDMAKTRKEFQNQIESGKNTPARELFKDAEKIMDEQSYVPRNVTDKDIAEMELMVKNRFQKGRKDNAEGGLQTMLGE